MIEIVKKLVTNYEEYIVRVYSDNTIVYNINNKEIILTYECICNPNYLNINIDGTTYYIYFSDIKNPKKYCDFIIKNRMDEAIILDGIERSIHNFRKNQIYKVSSDMELTEPEFL